MSVFQRSCLFNHLSPISLLFPGAPGEKANNMASSFPAGDRWTQLCLTIPLLFHSIVVSSFLLLTRGSSTHMWKGWSAIERRKCQELYSMRLSDMSIYDPSI
ncbi:hypothetical protein TNCV_2615691 [Trichonephila clavipes]|nr:hypothetical protein TNCV_2615691 [Trichonephila clavipes]